MIYSKQLLISVKTNASLSSHALMFLTLVASKGRIPAVICDVVGAINLISY
jgi:hypothetical protein